VSIVFTIILVMNKSYTIGGIMEWLVMVEFGFIAYLYDFDETEEETEMLDMDDGEMDEGEMVVQDSLPGGSVFRSAYASLATHRTQNTLAHQRTSVLVRHNTPDESSRRRRLPVRPRSRESTGSDNRPPRRSPPLREMSDVVEIPWIGAFCDIPLPSAGQLKPTNSFVYVPLIWDIVAPERCAHIPSRPLDWEPMVAEYRLAMADITADTVNRHYTHGNQQYVTTPFQEHLLDLLPDLRFYLDNHLVHPLRRDIQTGQAAGIGTYRVGYQPPEQRAEFMVGLLSTSMVEQLDALPSALKSWLRKRFARPRDVEVERRLNRPVMEWLERGSE